MTFRCYHCGAELDLTNVPAEVVAEWRATGSSPYVGLCSSCCPDEDAPVAVRS